MKPRLTARSATIRHPAGMDGGKISRRAALLGAGALAGTAALGAIPRGMPFSWELLKARADALAARPFAGFLPSRAAARGVDYDGREAIRFRAGHAQFGHLGGGGIQPFPLWRLAADPIELAVVTGGHASPVAFSRAMFEGSEGLPAGAEGFSGFRVMTPDGRSDWLAFQGASYFRSAGALNQYGLSMRGLAIDTGLATPEEFPHFTRFWLEDGPGDALTIYALLDSPSVAGAWRFVNRRGAAGVTQEVTFAARFRRAVTRLGVAPCTSMFWYGEGNRRAAIDWRPEIHDSDGLALLTGRGERIWRPLNNPSAVSVSSFADQGPRGFGLLQRDRTFDHYQDDGVFYERRPNLWVEPIGDWGAGAVSLVELPTTRETDDNIVAFWTPAAPVRAGTRLELAYRLHWTDTEPMPVPPARVVDSWRGTAGPPGSPPLPHATRLVADFAGPALAGLGPDSGVEPRVDLARGAPIHVVAYPLATAHDRWRLIVDVTEPGPEPLDLRAFLHRRGDALSETLVYQFDGMLRA